MAAPFAFFPAAAVEAALAFPVFAFLPVAEVVVFVAAVTAPVVSVPFAAAPLPLFFFGDRVSISGTFTNGKAARAASELSAGTALPATNVAEVAKRARMAPKFFMMEDVR